MNSFIVVAGPTGSGKTKLATFISSELSGEVVNIDSVQIYKDFEIGSATPTLGERGEVRHHLFGVLDPREPFDVAKYIRLAEEKGNQILEGGKVPVFSGGTSLYISALLTGLVDLPPADSLFRQSLSGRSTEELYDELSQRSPKRALEIASKDRVRIERALETLEAFSEEEIESRKQTQRYADRNRAVILVPVWERSKLYDRINQRTVSMIQGGLLDEVRGLVEKYGIDIPPLRTIGYKEAVSVLEGRLSESDLAESISKSTRRFAKRQMTWLRNEPIKRGWTVRPSNQDSSISLVGDLGSFSKPGRLKHFSALDISPEKLINELKNRAILPLSSTEIWFVNGEALM